MGWRWRRRRPGGPSARRLGAVACRLAMVAACLVGGEGCVGASRRRVDAPSREQVEQRRALSHEAQDAIDRADWATARGLLEHLAAEDPTSPEVQHRLGRVYLAQGELDGAGTAFERALSLDHEYADALCGLGQVLAARGRLTEALRKIEAAVEIDPRRASIHEVEGQVLEQLGRTDEALAAYFRVLAINPGSVPSLVRAGTIQLARQQNDQALSRLTQALEVSPGDGEALYQRGQAHLALGDVREAVQDLLAAAKQQPERADVQLVLARALELHRRPDEALAAAERASRLAPGDAEARALTERLRR